MNIDKIPVPKANRRVGIRFMLVKSPVRVSRSYTQTLAASPREVFPLLCPLREVQWAKGWGPSQCSALPEWWKKLGVEVDSYDATDRFEERGTQDDVS